MRDAVAAAGAPLRERVRARWVRAEGLHVTVCFLGNVPSAGVDGLIERSRELVRAAPPFTMSLGSPGAYGRGRRPVTAWLGIGEGEPQAAELIATCGHLLPKTDQRRPHPHVTLARDVSPDDAVLFRPAFAPVEGLAWRVNEVVLFRSHLGPGGSRYGGLAHLPLLGGTES